MSGTVAVTIKDEVCYIKHDLIGTILLFTSSEKKNVVIIVTNKNSEFGNRKGR